MICCVSFLIKVKVIYMSVGLVNFNFIKSNVSDCNGDGPVVAHSHGDW